VHGGTIRIDTLLFAGTTSVFWGVWPELACAAEPPPGVRRIVLEGGGPGGAEPELLLLELLELLELDGGIHGWIATVWVNVSGGITISFEPGGTAAVPDCTTSASEQGGTAIVSDAFCLGIWTVRMPGFMSAVDTASELELEELLLLLPPQALRPTLTLASAAVTASHLPAELPIVIRFSSRVASRSRAG
jgi:hypothetical protein